MKLLRALTGIAFVAQATALVIGGKSMHVDRDSTGLQSIVGGFQHDKSSRQPELDVCCSMLMTK